MTINYQFGDVDAHGAMIRAQAGLLEAEHQAIVRDVLAAGDFWGGAGSAACQGFITQLGRNFQVIYEQANAHGQIRGCRRSRRHDPRSGRVAGGRASGHHS
ncbi:WXG100 family type VII secretion target [Mycobacterium tuberculosis]|uniref:WXG100 family type VII secretion target n=1 Tax=Mycobacterium tuberculosis TaxID=1773 RepID=UPI000A67C8F6|nr:WXG100 family type VII secretion target [Mycobacterium tuberculosis]